MRIGNMPKGKVQVGARATVSVEPIAVGRETAAALFGIGVSTFEAHVTRGRLPKPRQLGGRAVWLLEELRAAAVALPVSEHLPPPAKGRSKL